MAAKRAASKKSGNGNGANLGFEQTLWLAADKLRNNLDAAEYKHVVLGLIFLKYISDAFAEVYAKLAADKSEGANPEDADEYRAQNVFWVPPEARWKFLQDNAKQPSIGKLVDEAMDAIERDNPSLKGVLPKQYARPALDKQRLGELIDLIGTIGLGDRENRSKDILGRVYEYFLSQFASAEGKKGGQFYTPRCVVRVLGGNALARTRAVCSTRAAAPAACSCRARSSSRSMAGGSATFPSTAKSRTRPRGGWQ